MATKQSSPAVAARRLSSILLLLGVVIGGVMALLFFWSQLLTPGELDSISLPLVALMAGLAATFNPCGLPALPGFLTFVGGSGEGTGARNRARLSLSASLGAMSLVLALGIVVAFVGGGIERLIAPYFRWVQLSVGLFLISMAVVHLMGHTTRLPLLGPIMGLGSRAWDMAMDKPTPRGSYLFGAGFVLVGVG